MGREFDSSWIEIYGCKGRSGWGRQALESDQMKVEGWFYKRIYGNIQVEGCS